MMNTAVISNQSWCCSSLQCCTHHCLQPAPANTTQLIGDRSHDDTALVAALFVCYCVLSYTSSQSWVLVLYFGQYDKGPEMAEDARRRVIISGFEVTSPFVILSRKTVGGEWLDWRAGNLSSEVEISAIQAPISGVWEDILLANVPHLNCDILNVEQLKFWNNTIQPWRWCWCGDGEHFCF